MQFYIYITLIRHFISMWRFQYVISTYVFKSLSDLSVEVIIERNFLITFTSRKWQAPCKKEKEKPRKSRTQNAEWRIPGERRKTNQDI